MKKNIFLGWKLLNIGLLISCVILISGMFGFDESEYVDAVYRSDVYADLTTMETTLREANTPEKSDSKNNLYFESIPNYRSIATNGNNIPMKTAYTTDNTASQRGEQLALPPTEKERQDTDDEEIIFSEPIEPRYGFTDEDIYLLTQLLCGSKDISGDGEYDFDWYVQHGQEPNHLEIGKVLCVVMNRVRADKWGDTVYGVVMQRGQFAVMPRNTKKTPCPLALEIVRAWCEGYDAWDESVQVIPENHYFFREGPNITNITRCDF